MKINSSVAALGRLRICALEAEAGESCEFKANLVGLHSEFQANMVRPCLKKQTNKNP